LETVALRYFNIFGPRQDPKSPYSAVIPLFITRLLAGERPIVYGDGGQSRDFCFVANVVHANLLASTAPNVAGRVFNVGTGRATSLLELLSQLNHLLGTNVEPAHEPPRIGDVRDSMADITLARTVLDYEPLIDLEEGLRRSIEYYRSII
jgi:nucleoside-diphosphate-sugar epimerase